MREKTTHLYVDSRERTLPLYSLVELKNQLIQQGKYGELQNKFIDRMLLYT